MLEDPDAYREEARTRWNAAASGWEARRADFQKFTQPVSMWLVEHVAPQPGTTILELAAGLGDTGLLAAELVQPGGRVILTDAVEGMVEGAERRARQLGLAGVVEVRQMEAEWIDLPTASLDGVLCRWGYMLLADPVSALQETRRVLRPGRRVALAAWTGADDNPWSSEISRALVDLELVAPADHDQPGQFAWAKPGKIEAALAEAGFDEPLVETVSFVQRFESLDAHFAFQRQTSPSLIPLVPTLTPEQHTKLRDAADARLAPYVQADGSVELPARTWVAVASA
jgi:SAM-dependent methyltransferase